MLRFVFLRLCVSLADRNTAISESPAARARSRPLALGTSALNVTPGGALAPARTSSSASASCGIHRGETKLVSSMRASPPRRARPRAASCPRAAPSTPRSAGRRAARPRRSRPALGTSWLKKPHAGVAHEPSVALDEKKRELASSGRARRPRSGTRRRSTRGRSRRARARTRWFAGHGLEHPIDRQVAQRIGGEVSADLFVACGSTRPARCASACRCRSSRAMRNGGLEMRMCTSLAPASRTILTILRLVVPRTIESSMTTTRLPREDVARSG